ncbi:hypothetical protein O181_013657 [Austropuccinia psidii MF-1]|uniref:Uncharacterized protein n=1 Tax=Austropuccinia psidii MF-1 TaxID=1389203 RepID=A0A9Q3C040_9BASI|nr:hypothetical protein [Austropuccinia psidii MF-1]
MVTYQQLQPVGSTSRRREDPPPFLFPAIQGFQRRNLWTVWVTREAPSMENEGQDAVARLCRMTDRNSREVIAYANKRMIPGTASEEMASKLIWY